MAPARKPIKERLLRTFREQDGCWIWTGSCTKDGYGVMGVGRKQFRAHRLSYQEFKGLIPVGKQVCHRCDTPRCINPDHLFLGTALENTKDMIAKGRAVNVRGNEHPNTRVSPAKRVEIKRLRQSGRTLQEIASQYGVVFKQSARFAME